MGGHRSIAVTPAHAGSGAPARAAPRFVLAALALAASLLGCAGGGEQSADREGAPAKVEAHAPSDERPAQTPANEGSPKGEREPADSKARQDDTPTRERDVSVAQGNVAIERRDRRETRGQDARGNDAPTPATPRENDQEDVPLGNSGG